jgi:hypothetical protein
MLSLSSLLLSATTSAVIVYTENLLLRLLITNDKHNKFFNVPLGLTVTIHYKSLKCLCNII